MKDHTVETSPQVYARIGGLLYLVIIVTGILGELLIRGRIVVSGDVTATANNIMASQLLWRMGIVADLLMHVCDIPLMLVFYVLLKPVNRNLALLAVLFNLVQTAVMVAYKLNLLVPLFLLGNTDYMKAFEPHQLDTIIYLAIKADGYGFGIGLIFFGFECLILGYLIFKSGFLPKIIGVLMPIAGLCYLTNSFILLLAPKYTNVIFPLIMIPPFIAETSFCLWLLLKGVNVPKWKEKARTF